MPTIKFTHAGYRKLYNPVSDTPVKTARLLDVVDFELSSMSEPMRDYDTTYETDDQDGKYPLAQHGLALLLIFQKPTQGMKAFNVFTTIRRYTGEKQRYYRSMIGKVFDVVITEGE